MIGSLIMPRGQVTKAELLARIFKYKTSLFEEPFGSKNLEWHEGAHDSLNKVLDMLAEYRE
jgi:hypothetical protein